MCDLVARTGRHQQRYEAGCRLVAGYITRFFLTFFLSLFLYLSPSLCLRLFESLFLYFLHVECVDVDWCDGGAIANWDSFSLWVCGRFQMGQCVRGWVVRLNGYWQLAFWLHGNVVSYLLMHPFNYCVVTMAGLYLIFRFFCPFLMVGLVGKDGLLLFYLKYRKKSFRT